MAGWNRLSIGYFSADGFKFHNYPFTGTSYGPPLREGDVLGIGYRPRTGCVFFTRNGRKLEDAYVGLNRANVFPTIGADGPAAVHVNLGQAGFVFIEANVKKWGLAPMAGTLAPPPAYGHQMGSILLAAAEGGPASGGEADRRENRRSEGRNAGGRGEDGGPRIPAAAAERDASATAAASSSGSTSRRRPSGRAGADVRPRLGPGSAAPVVPSPLRASEGAVEEEGEIDELSDEISDGASEGSDMPHNPVSLPSVETRFGALTWVTPADPATARHLVGRVRPGRRPRRRHGVDRVPGPSTPAGVPSSTAPATPVRGVAHPESAFSRSTAAATGRWGCRRVPTGLVETGVVRDRDHPERCFFVGYRSESADVFSHRPAQVRRRGGGSHVGRPLPRSATAFATLLVFRRRSPRSVDAFGPRELVEPFPGRVVELLDLDGRLRSSWKCGASCRP